MMWHVPGTYKRVIVTLTVDLDHPKYPPLTTIEGGEWTFTLSDVLKSQLK